MKKLMLILIGAFISVSLFAQWSNPVDYGGGTTQRTVIQKTLPAGVTFYKYTGVTADTTGAEQDSLFFEILSNKNAPLTCNARLEFDTIQIATDGEVYAVSLQGKVFENDTWTSIKDETSKFGDISLYEPSTSLADSANQVTINNGNSDNYYRYFRVLIANDATLNAGNKAVIDYVIFNLYER